jgi:AGZA family xanthine/uracil permease-like MFS transporter
LLFTLAYLMMSAMFVVKHFLDSRETVAATVQEPPHPNPLP